MKKSNDGKRCLFTPTTPLVRTYEPRALHHFIDWTYADIGDRGLPILYLALPGAPHAPAFELHDYTEANHEMPTPWHLYHLRSFGWLYDYLVRRRPYVAARIWKNQRLSLHRDVFHRFARDMVSGTLRFGEEGPKDPSGLYWLPSDLAEVQKRLRAIRDIELWMQEKASSRTVPSPGAAPGKHIVMTLPSPPVHDMHCSHTSGRDTAETNGLFRQISSQRLCN